VVSVIPFALGASISPAVLTIELLILAGKTKPKSRTWFYLSGAVAVLVVFALLAMTVLRNLSDSDGGPVNPATIVVKIVCALLLAVLGFRQIHPAKTQGEKHASTVKSHLASAPLPFFAGIGAIAMLTNFSTLLLFLPGMHQITRSSDDYGVKVFAAIVLFVVTLIPLLLPALAVTLLGAKSDAVLGKLSSYVTRFSRQINAGICFVFAAILLFEGLKAWIS
jgi:hypothetical protein